MSVTKTHTLLGYYQQRRRPTTFFTNQFVVPPNGYFRTAKVKYHVSRGGEEVAVVQQSRDGTQYVQRETAGQQTIEPPDFSLTSLITRDDMETVLPGMKEDDSLSVREYRTHFARDHFLTHSDMIRRAIERICAEVMTTGKCELQDSSGNAQVTLDFQGKSDNYTTDVTKTAFLANPVGTLETWISTMDELGYAPSRLVLGDDIRKDFLQNESILDLMNKLNVDRGQLSRSKRMEDGSIEHGELDVGGCLLRITSYRGSFKLPGNATRRPYMPKLGVGLIDETARNWRHLLFGNTELLVDPEPLLLAGVANSRVSDGPFDATLNASRGQRNKSVEIETSSRPVAVPVSIDGHACHQLVDS